MSMRSINPANGETVKVYDTWDDAHLQRVLHACSEARPAWAASPISERCELMRKAAAVLRRRKQELAETITQEMGKLFKDAVAEIEKCAGVCEYYADNGPQFLTGYLPG